MSDYALWRTRFAASLDPRLYPIEYLDALVASGQARVWASDRAAIVAGLRQYPGGAVAVHGQVAAGKLSEIRKLIPLAEAWGRANGAIFAEIESRLGWQRTLADDGYQPMQLCLRKEL